MLHLPHVSHLFRLLPGAVLGVAGSALPATATASGSALVRTVENSTAQHRAGGFRGSGIAAGNGLTGTHANSAGSATGFLGPGAGRAHLCADGRRPEPAPPLCPPTRSTGLA